MSSRSCLEEREELQVAVTGLHAAVTMPVAMISNAAKSVDVPWRT